MKLTSLITARPLFFFLLLAVLVLILPASVIPYWHKMAKQMEHDMELNSKQLHSGMESQIKNTAKLLQPITSSSAPNLAALVASSIGVTDHRRLTFSDIKTKVAPSLFQALLTTPHISQIAFIGSDGLFFSYYVDGNKTLALYSYPSSSSSVSLDGDVIAWYKQAVDSNTGKLQGEATMTNPLNTTSYLEALKSRDGVLGFLGTGWNEAKDALFLNTAAIRNTNDGPGSSSGAVVSLGFPVKEITDLFTGVDLYGGRLSMAAADGEVLVDGFPFARMVVVNNSVSFQQTGKPNNESQRQISTTPTESVSCTDGAAAATISIGETDYKVHCSEIEIAGVKSVYALAVPLEGLGSLVHRTQVALILLAVMAVSVLIAVLAFVFVLVRGSAKEMHLRASLIKQAEATQQAERKSMNKSLAFANASHDIRAALAGITGLIEECFAEVSPGSVLETNLTQMNGCANDLLGLLNSILDISKVESGKMQLQKEDFNMTELLEDVVDLFHPVAMKKGVEVVLDPCDGSLLKHSNVIGDRGKLKQILSNLLSNAVKFTTEGHVTVRAWVKEPSETANHPTVVSSSRPRRRWSQALSCLFYKNNSARNDLEAVDAAERDENAMDFIFEVEDTGKGIPKDKRKSVFENYVQVKQGEGGTGLGLGIVQSLVRLMGGDIDIVDKENEERGACFRFNVFVTTSDAASINGSQSDPETAAGGERPLQCMNLKGKAPSPRLTNILNRSSSRQERSHVVLLIGNEERGRAAHKFMEKLGINVSVVNRWERLHSTLRRLKSKFSTHSPHSSLGKSGHLSSRSDSEGASASFKEVPLSAMEGSEHKLPAQKRRGAPSFILLVLDAAAGPFAELFSIVADFRRDLQCSCKVVWLDKPTSRSINLDGLEGEMMDPDDDILLKPFHGSRLYKVIKLLPEFGGVQLKHRSGRLASSDGGSSSYSKHSFRRERSSRSRARHHEIQEEGSGSSSSEQSRREFMWSAPAPIKTRCSGDGQSSRYTTHRAAEEECGDTSREEKPLTGKRVLVVDDSPLLRKLAEATLKRAGATVEGCSNGLEALKLVRDRLQDQRDLGASHILPYDYIFMDCEMAPMNGFEATRRIREEERRNQVRTPIIALTAHTGEEANKTIEAGMDMYLAKPLNKDNLMEAIRFIHSRPPFGT